MTTPSDPSPVLVVNTARALRLSLARLTTVKEHHQESSPVATMAESLCQDLEELLTNVDHLGQLVARSRSKDAGA